MSDIKNENVGKSIISGIEKLKLLILKWTVEHNELKYSLNRSDISRP